MIIILFFIENDSLLSVEINAMKKSLILLMLVACFMQSKAISHIRWGSTGDPLNGLTITWSNTGTHDSIQWGYTASMTNGHFAGVKRTGYTGNFFNYTFPSVTASSTIYYKLYDSNTSSWGSQSTFKTAPPVSTTTYSFLCLGDSRTNMGPWGQIATLSNAKNTNFTLYTGDIVNSGATNSDWDNWFNNGVSYLQNNLIYHACGNHDAADTTKYQNIFTMPVVSNSKMHYSFTYGNAIFICMNTENSTTSEYNWMVSVLQANQSKTWKVLFFHRPFFTIGTHAGEMNAELSTWWAAFDTYGVDLILNGHDHMYERSKPINYSVSTTSPVAQYGSGAGQGRCEIVCGGAGAPLYTGSTSWFVQTYQSKYNFCKFNVNGCILTDSTFDNTGALIETFSLNKCATGIENKIQVFNPITCVPNPTDGNFTLKYSAAVTGTAVISILDLDGKQVAQETYLKTQTDMEFTYDMSKFAKGIYSVQVTIGDQKDATLLIVK